jgi:hypothetical protein
MNDRNIKSEESAYIGILINGLKTIGFKHFLRLFQGFILNQVLQILAE